jgi:hypothetical protein
MAVDTLSDALGTTPSLVKGLSAQPSLRGRADFARSKLGETFESGARAEEEAAKAQFGIEQGQRQREATAERDLANKSRAETAALEAGLKPYSQFEAPQIKASDYAKNAGMRLLSSLIVGGLGGASARAQLVAIREMQDAEDRVQGERFSAAKLKFDEADKARKEHNNMLKDRFDRMLNLLSKDRNAAMVEAKLIESQTGNGLISAQLRKGNYQKAYELFTKAIAASDQADAELAKQQAILAGKKELKAMGSGGGGGEKKVKISDLPSDLRKQLKEAGDAVTNLNNINSTKNDKYFGISNFADSGSLMLQAVERGGSFADIANKVSNKPIDAQTVDWWKSYWEYISKVRNQLYGATLTKNEQADFERFTITPATDKATAVLYFERQRGVLDRAIKKKQAEALGALKAQTPEELVTSLSSAGGVPAAPRIATKADVAETARANRMTEAQAKAELRKRGFTIEGE